MSEPTEPGGSAAGGPIVHGYPHLETVRSALTALYRRLSGDGVARFAASVRPELVDFPDDEELYLGAQRVARVMVQHFRLPDARMVVGFRDMVHAGNVELAAGPEYFVELHSRFKADRRDVGAALAHEVMHVYLHRLGLEFAGTRDNEILTDTATAYLGAGWLLLDAYREEAAIRGERLMMSAYKLGYLTPEEFGYVLAKRALAFGDDIEPWFRSAQAREAYRAGLARAKLDLRRPPLAGASLGGAAAVREESAGRGGAALRRLLLRRRGAGSEGVLPLPYVLTSASGSPAGGGSGRGALCAVRCWTATRSHLPWGPAHSAWGARSAARHRPGGPDPDRKSPGPRARRAPGVARYQLAEADHHPRARGTTRATRHRPAVRTQTARAWARGPGAPPAWLVAQFPAPRKNGAPSRARAPRHRKKGGAVSREGTPGRGENGGAVAREGTWSGVAQGEAKVQRPPPWSGSGGRCTVLPRSAPRCAGRQGRPSVRRSAAGPSAGSARAARTPTPVR